MRKYFYTLEITNKTSFYIEYLICSTEAQLKDYIAKLKTDYSVKTNLICEKPPTRKLRWNEKKVNLTQNSR